MSKVGGRGAAPQVVIVTGASSGIGYATAERLACKGYRVYGCARRTERMEPLCSLGVTPLRLDVTDQESAEATVGRVLEAEGRVDVLVNNAGYGSLGPVEVVSLKEAQRQLDVNVLGVARMTRLVLPTMRAQGGGRILIVSSVGGRVTSYLGGWYHVSKYGVEALANALRMETADFGIRVSLIEPSGVITEWGSIAADHCEAVGRGSAYEEETAKVAQMFRRRYAATRRSPMMNTSDRLGDLLVKVIEARRPRSRYQDTPLAKATVAMARLLPDQAVDRVMRAVATQ